MKKLLIWLWIGVFPMGLYGDVHLPVNSQEHLFLTEDNEDLTAVGVNGKLSVKNGKLVNQHGVPPQLRGISFSWSIWEGEKYYTTEVVDWLIDDFNVNLIRLSMAIEPKGGYLEFPEMQKKKITTLIDHAIENGIYVLIDWHDHNADQHKEESKLFFKEMAQRYYDVPNVLYEIWNEPERQTWAVIKAYSEEIIAEIRKHDKDNIIIVGSPQWDQDVDVVAEDPIRLADNLVYSFHFYASDPWHQDQLRQKAEKAMELDLPLMVTEWGVGESNGDGEFNLKKTNNWVDWMERHQLSWVNWNVTDKKETTALLKPNASTHGFWKINELTAAGIYIREQLRRLNVESNYLKD